MDSRIDLNQLRCDLESCLSATDDLGLFAAGAHIAQAIDRIAERPRGRRPFGANESYVISEGPGHGR